MPIISLDGLSFYGLAWPFKSLSRKQRLAYGMLGHLPVDFSDQHMVSYNDKGYKMAAFSCCPMNLHMIFLILQYMLLDHIKPSKRKWK